MEGTDLSLEIFLEKQCFTKPELKGHSFFIEVSIKKKVFRSKLFKEKERPAKLMSVQFIEELPLGNDKELMIQLFLDLPSKVLLVGSEFLNLCQFRIPSSSYFTIRQRHGFLRLLGLRFALEKGKKEEHFGVVFDKSSYKQKNTSSLFEFLEGRLKEFEKEVTPIVINNEMQEAKLTDIGEGNSETLKGKDEVEPKIKEISKKQMDFFLNAICLKILKVAKEGTPAVKSKAELRLAKEQHANTPHTYKAESCLFEEDFSPFFPGQYSFLTCCDNKNSLFISKQCEVTMYQSLKEHLKFPHYYFSGYSFLEDGSIIISGGLNSDQRINSQGIFYFNPKKGRLFVLREMTKPKIKHHQLYYNGCIYILGGKFIDNQEATMTVSKLSLQTNTWKQLPELLIPTSYGKIIPSCSCVHKGMMVVVFGNRTILTMNLEKEMKWENYKLVKIKELKSNDQSIIFSHQGHLYLFFKSSNVVCNLSIVTLNIAKGKQGKREAHLLEVIKIKKVEWFFKFVYTGEDILMFPDPFSNKMGVMNMETKKYRIISNREIKFNNEKKNKYTKKGVLAHCPVRDIVKNSPRFYFIDKTNFTLFDSNFKKIFFGDYHNTFTDALPDKNLQITLKELIGVHHCFANFVDGKQVIFNFLQKRENGLFFSNKVFVLGGISKKNAYILKASVCPLNVLKPSLIRLRSLIYVFGGIVMEKGKQYNENFLESKVELNDKFGFFDFDLNEWRIVGRMPEKRYSSYLHFYNNSIFFLGGYDENHNFCEEIIAYNLVKSKWRRTGVYLKLGIEKTHLLSHFFLNNKLYVLNNSVQNGNNVFELNLVTMESNEWESSFPSTFKIHHFMKLRQNKLSIYYTKHNEEHKIMRSKLLLLPELPSCLSKEDNSVEGFFEKSIVKEETGKIKGKSVNSPKLIYDLTKINKKSDKEEKPARFAGQPSDLLSLKSLFSLNTCFYLDFLKLSACQNNPRNNEKLILLESGKLGETLPVTYDCNTNGITRHEIYSLPDKDTKYTSGLASINFPMNAAITSLDDGCILVVGGEVLEGNKMVASNRCWKFNPLKRTFREAKRISVPRVGHSILNINGYIYIFGGREGQSGSFVSEVEYFNQVNKTWHKGRHMVIPRINFGIAAYPGKVYILGGESEDGSILDTAEYYDLEMNEFFLVLEGKSVLHKPLTGITSLRVSCNKFIYLGGRSETGENCEIGVLLIKDDYQELNTIIVGQTFFSHISCCSARFDGKLYLFGGNSFGGCEKISLSNYSAQKLNFKASNNFMMVKMENNLSQTTSSIHSNPRFDKLYIFGIDKKNEIWRVHMKDFSWESLRVPDGLEFWDYSICLTIPDGRIVMNGGINSLLKDIKKSCKIITPLEDTVEFVNVSDMTQKRYTHTAVYLNDYVYVLGGRFFGNGEEGVIKHCERMNLKSLEWEVIAPMHVRRCTAVASSYKNHIYMIGGYRGDGRCQSIERYDELRNSWDVVSLLLKYPIEASVLVHFSRHEILLMGGKDQYSEQDYVTLYNLEDNLTEDLPFLKDRHVLAKGGMWKDKLLIVGGSTNDKVEICTLPGWKWEIVNSVFLMPQKMFSKTSFAQSY